MPPLEYDFTRWHALTVAVLLSIGLIIPFCVSDFVINFITKILIFGLAALSVDLLVGYVGLVSFGHAAFVAVGAYITGILSNAGYESAFIVWPCAIMAASLVALIIGALSLRSSGLYFIMITLAFAQMVFFLLQSLQIYGGGDGFSVNRNFLSHLINPYNPTTLYFVFLTIVVTIIFLIWLIVHSEFGVVLRAARDDETRLKAVGLSPFSYRLVAFTISGGIAGLAGALLANLIGYITPSLASWHLSGELLVMVLLGGAGKLVGGFIGAAIFLGLAEILSEVTEHWMFYLGILIILRVVFVRRSLLTIFSRGCVQR